MLSDPQIDRLREVLDAPDLGGTKYRVIEEIGRGGMGAVYAAEDTELGRRVALKVLHVTDVSGEAAPRMLREARILARLEHPGIVPVHDAGTLPDGRVFYAMKLVQGHRLDHYRDGAQALSELLRVFQKICEAVAFAHANGVIHRDLKPRNIMVGSFGEVLVMDWGVARLLRTAEHPAAPAAAGEPGDTRAGTVLGTPDYMSPEQGRGEEVDERSDVYALGAVLRFLLGMNAVPRPLDAICRKAMAAGPADRYATVGDLASDVVRFADGAPVSAYRENLFEQLARVASKYRAAIFLVVAYLIMRVLVLLFLGR